MNRLSKTKVGAAWRWLARLVRHFQVVGKRGTFVCARGLTNQCVITGIIYDSPFHRELAYRINYMPADSDLWVDGAEIPTDIFVPNPEPSGGA